MKNNNIQKTWTTKKISKKPSSSFKKKKINTKKPKKNYSKRINSYNYSKRKQKKSFIKNLLSSRVFWKTIFTLFILGCLFVFFIISWFSRGLPDPNQLMSREVPQSTIIYDRTGENILYEIHGEERRTLLTLDEIPFEVQKATIAIEDKNFYQHSGFSVFAIFRTIITNVLYNKKAGGSTLTQQFVKNAILSSEKSYERKIKELILAYKLEKKFSKDEILQMYLNEIPYGSNAYGVEAASEKYFGKPVKELALEEAAILAALPQAPSLYSPYGANKETLLARKDYILDLMEEQGYITKNEKTLAQEKEIIFNKPTTNITAPHFVMYVKQLLSEKYGEKTLEQGGLKIYTTLDLYKQEIAEEAVMEYAEKNKENYNANNAALVSIDPKTGQVLAMVGSKDYFNEEIDGQFNVAVNPRQPGSSFKPFVYASLFEKGYTPNTILFDSVTNFSNSSDSYEPKNYNNKEFGPVSIKKALAGSLNIPAVKAVYLSGLENVLNLAKNSGYTTLNDKDRFGLSIVLGGAEVKLIEHVNAYSVFAREGKINPISVILRIEDNKGNILEEYKEKTKTILPSNISRMINNILSDNNARSYVFGEDNYLHLKNRPVAAKTGTTNSYRDAWTIGYTPSLVTGVWVGNNDNTEMRAGAGGSSVAAPIWNYFMKKTLGDTPVESFKEPEIKKTGIDIIDGTINFSQKIKIDSISGLLATENTPENLIEEKEFFNYHSILYYINKENPLEEKTDDFQDPQFENWENGIINWINKRNQKIENEEDDYKDLEKILLPPTEKDNIHIPENLPNLEITKPKKNEKITNRILSVNINYSSKKNINRSEYYIDDVLVFINKTTPYNLNKDIGFIKKGTHKLTVVLCDEVENCTKKETTFIYNGPEINYNLNDVKISITSPVNGTILNEIDFPLSINTDINSFQKLNNISFILENENGEIKKIKELFSLTNNSLNILWENKPKTGNYSIWIEGVSLGLEKIISNKINLIIN